MKNIEFIGIPKFAHTESVIGMAVYHADNLEWVTQAVNSIIQQSYQNYTFIIVIDGHVNFDVFSYLKSISINEDHVYLAQGEHQSGLSTCMNFVIEYALTVHSQFFFRMDSDDISTSNRFQTQIDYFNDHSDIDVLGSALTEIDEVGKKVGARRFPENHHILFKILPIRCPINHPTVAIRTSVFEQGFRYDVSKLNTQDYFLWVILAKAGFKFANIRTPLLYYRRVQGFYKRRGVTKSVNEFKARQFAMKSLKAYTLKNFSYSFVVLMLRMMPSFIVKLAYKFDRKYIHGHTEKVK